MFLFPAALFTTHIGVLYVACFWFGVGLIGRFTTGFVLLTETLCKRHQAMIGTILMIGDSAATIYITIAMKIFHNAYVMVWLGFVFNILAFLACFMLYESPSWLVSKGRNNEAK